MNKSSNRSIPTNAAEFTVSEISGALKRVVEDAFGYVRVRGEISGYRGPHSSGHAYFSLKDERARLEAVIWRGVFSKLKFPPEEGLEVIASGKLTTYPGSSKYQIVIDNIEPAGAGALMALLEARKKQLAGEGLFDEARKQLLPYMPRVVGVVTSPTGAVIRDIIHRITDRFPLHVMVWPIRVQGETSGTEAARAIEGFNGIVSGGPLKKPDVIIVARGGGSLEDLWGFNDEALVRAVANSDIPIISAIGHETDWTLIDLAADVRAPTPTGAAEMAVPVKADLEARIADLSARLKSASSRHLDRKQQQLTAIARALPSPDLLLALPRRGFDEIAARLGRALEAGTERKRNALTAIRISPPLLARLVRERRIVFDAAAARVRPDPLIERLSQAKDRVKQASKRSDRAAIQAIDQQKRSIGEIGRLLTSLSYPAVLGRGYAIVSDTDGKALMTAASVKPGSRLTLQFADGKVGASADGDDNPGSATPQRKRKQSQSKQGNGQGSLF
ncbi:MAG: exodeoxyribonuclease VII large subunit [Rhizobiaceae bacterium]